MGAQAEAALREALAMGLDRAVHLLGREFAGRIRWLLRARSPARSNASALI